MRSRFFSKRAIPKHSKIHPKKEIKRRIQNPNLKEKEENISKQQKMMKLDTKEVQNFKNLGQGWKKLIISIDKKSTKIYLIDQHAAHERIRYTYLKNYFLENYDFCSKFKSIYLRHRINNFKYSKEIINYCEKWDVIHLKIEKIFRKIFYKKNQLFDIERTRINDDEIGKYYEEESYEIRENFLERLKEILEKMRVDEYEFSLKSRKNPRIILKKYPIFFGKISSICLIKEEIENIDTFNCIKFNQIPKSLDKIFKEKSCKSAIKFNDEINKGQANEILGDLKLCDYPLFCIHGRKTVHPLNIESIRDKGINYIEEIKQKTLL